MGGSPMLQMEEEKKEKKYYIIIDLERPNKDVFLFAYHYHIFCEDYNKVIYGVTHSLSLFRQDDGYAIHRAENDENNGADADAKVEITKIKWVIPQIKPSLEIASGLIGEIEKKKIVQIGFKERKCDKKPVTEGTNWSWRLAVTTGAETPRFLILGFQTGDRMKQVEPVGDAPSETNASTFNNCKIHAIQVQMLGRLYPSQAQPINFAQNDWSKAYRNVAEFRRKMDGTPGMFSHGGINPIDFQTLYSLYVFDLSNQVAKLRTGVVDVLIKVKFHENPPANTMAYAVTISDKVFSLKSDGSKMTAYPT